MTYYVALHFTKRMRIFHIRVLLDSSQDVFRDIEIEEKSTFLDLHNAIIEAFKFSGMEMASFYMSNEHWDKGEEIALIDIMNDPDQEPVRAMSETPIHELMHTPGDKMLYLYDFMRMWIFYVELINEVERRPDVTYPEIVLWVGNAPAENSKVAGPMQADFEGDDDMIDSDYGFDEDDEGFEHYDDSFEY